MRYFDSTWLMESVAQQMRRTALTGFYNGIPATHDRRYFAACRATHEGYGTVLIFTRDIGMHSGGWWKNPDYERCWHLSLSFRDPITGELAPQDRKVANRWIEAFYGEDKRYVWAEPPFSPDGHSADVWHYRVFCDPAWQPILPRGEVYTREFTERGWKSFSELQSADAEAMKVMNAYPGGQ